MMNNRLIAGITAIIIIGLVILVFVEASTPPQIITRREQVYVPYPYERRRRRRVRVVKGDRSTPFCLHTANGCYPGTQTPIP